MRNKLQKFTAFANTLLPHETQYLLSIQQFTEPDRLAILQRVDANAQQVGQFTPYDTQIDKRKYNHLQNWITERLRAIDADEQLRTMLQLTEYILTDTIDQQQEKQLLKMIRQERRPIFFHVFYELANHYLHFLQIRLRYRDHQLVYDFLTKNRSIYDRSKAAYDQMHRVTADIVGQYDQQRTESAQWEDWLSTIFYDEELDAYLRYQALVRLTFISYNYRRYDNVKDKFTYLEAHFRQGNYYSRRLLLNFYNSLLMLYAHERQYDKALYYGYLSVRTENHDYPLYVNNLCAVLLRLQRYDEALQLLRQAAPAMKKTSNFHNRVGFVAFYVETLNRLGQYDQAERYGRNFLLAYSKEILRFRWHLFFSVYLEALMYQRDYQQVIKTVAKYRLLAKDKSYERKPGYLANIPLLLGIAHYQEGVGNKAEILQLLQQHHGDSARVNQRANSLASVSLLDKCFHWAPELRFAWQKVVG